MKRAHGHLVFALVAASFGAIAIAETVRLEHAERINGEVAQWSEATANTAEATAKPTAPTPEPMTPRAKPTDPVAKPIEATAKPTDPVAKPIEATAKPTDPVAKPIAATAKPTAPPANTTTKWLAGTADALSPEGRLARAVALSKYDYDAALAAYKAIIQSNREDLRRTALYDLGNLHLHQAIKAGVADESQSLPLTELAKQSYRDLLRRDPTDWDARYNLERSLRLAPEDEDDTDADTGPPDPHEHERSTIADPRMDLP
jgi:tetratricopeptide (TPR) repeat protein